jgi:hypothetical protein
MKGLLLGAVAGALAAMYWRDDLKRMQEKSGLTSSGSVREHIADALESLEASVGERLDRARAAACSTIRSWSRTVRAGTERAPSEIPERPQSLEG